MNRTNRANNDLAMSETMKYLVSASLILMGGGIMTWLYLLREQTEKQDSNTLLPVVATHPVTVFEGELDLEVSGTVVPFREIRIGAEVAGVVALKHAECQAGNLVKRGTKLLEIDQRDYQLEIKTLKSEERQAERTLDETDEEIRGALKNIEIAKSDLELQEKEHARVMKLRQSVAAAEMDQARRALLNSQSQLTLRQNAYDMLLKKKERLRSSLDLIHNRMERAELNLERTVIRAPADGVIVRENVEQGDFVSVARELLVFECTAQVEVLCSLTPGELDWVRKYADANDQMVGPNGQVYGLPQLEVILHEQSDPSTQWIGVLERFDGIGLNETTKSVPCRIVVKQPVSTSKSGRKKALVRGMYLKCQMVVPVEHIDTELVSFPASAMQPGDFVWAVRERRLNRFYVDVVDRTPPLESFSDPSKVVVELGNSGLIVGDQIVTSPLPQPVVGGEVILQDRDETAATDRETETQVNIENPKESQTEVHTTTSANGKSSERSQP